MGEYIYRSRDVSSPVSMARAVENFEPGRSVEEPRIRKVPREPMTLRRFLPEIAMGENEDRGTHWEEVLLNRSLTGQWLDTLLKDPRGRRNNLTGLRRRRERNRKP